MTFELKDRKPLITDNSLRDRLDVQYRRYSKYRIVLGILLIWNTLLSLGVLYGL